MKFAKKRVTQASLWLKCTGLFFKNVVLIRVLKFNHVSVYEKVVIQGSEIELLWNVIGCHKIKIEGIGVFPGNSHGIKLIFSNRNNPIHIRFYGLAKKLEKKVNIYCTYIHLPDKFNRFISVPIAAEVTCNRDKLEFELSKYHLKMDLQPVKLKFTPFRIENYLSIKTIQ